MELKKASRKQSKLRIWLSWPSGSWKTHSALLLAYWICWDWEKIAVIDTENWSADLYSHLWDYNVLHLQPDFSPEKYIEAIRTCEEAEVEVIIIDSTSHEWEWKWWCLEINEKIAQIKFKWNTWSSWSVTTPRHQSFIENIVNSKCHIITTARSKTDTIQTEDRKIKKVWLKDIQREGFEYEMTIMFNIDRDWHLAIASKDRTNLFIDRDPFVISIETWEEIKNWNLSWDKVLSIQEKQQFNYNNLYETFTHIQNKEIFDEELKVFKQNLAKDTQFISKNQLNEIWEIINNLKNTFLNN